MPPDRLRPWFRWFAIVIGLIGFVSFAWSLRESIATDGGRAFDAAAYWIAGSNVLGGRPLYEPVGIGDPGAFRNTPTFALLMAPLSVLPELAFTWLYRLACLLCLRYLVGSWVWVGWSLLLPPVVIELIALNVTFPLAALSRWSLRGPSAPFAPALMPFAATIKVGPILLVPYLWVHRPEHRRALLIGAVAVLVVTAAHVAIAPASWTAFAEAMLQQSRSVNEAPYVGDQLIVLVPSTFWDFVVRLALAAALTAIAIWKGWTWLAFTAATLAVPTLWLARLAALVAVPRLALEDWQAARSRRE